MRANDREVRLSTNAHRQPPEGIDTHTAKHP